MSAEQTIIREILGHLEAEPVSGLRRHDVLKRLGHVDAGYFRGIFARLVREGRIICKRGGRYVAAASQALHQGIFRCAPRGFGFVKPSDGGPELFVPEEELRGCITGDLVLYRVTQNEHGPCASIIRVLEHARPDFVGCLVERHGVYSVRPMRRDLPPLLPLFQDGPTVNLNGAKVGDWVQATFLPRTDERKPLQVAIARRLAASATITGDLKAVCQEYGLPSPYSAASERHASALRPREIPREDCRHLEVFTIDPMDARDFDDAISLQSQSDGNLVVGVHIADVGCYVQSGTPLERAARRRGFTSYLPGRTIHMLPQALSADLCSLREGEERLAHTIFLTIEPQSGAILHSRRVHTLICSRHRLCYEQVERVLAGEDVDGIDESLAATLIQLGKLTQALRHRRAEQEGFLPFDGAELRVICTGNPPQVTGMAQRQQGVASELVEELMLAANVEVARELARRQLPVLYRNHASPSGEHLHQLSEQAAQLLSKKRVQLNNRQQMCRFLQEVQGSAFKSLLNMLMLRCMPRAQYGVSNLGHFGLGKECYCHFTSPIRRYPDLLVHLQLIAADTGSTLLTREFLAEQELSCNALEQNNDQASFALEDRLKLRLIREKLAEESGYTLECMVLKAVPSGLSLYDAEHGLMAFMPIEELRGYRFQPKSNSLSDGRHSYTLGSTIFTRPGKLDPIRGELLMKPAGVALHGADLSFSPASSRRHRRLSRP